MNDSHRKFNYGEAILAANEYLLDSYPEVFVMGQGVWSPWYVGNSMTDLDKKFGPDRVIDTPVSESACTGAGVGASLAGMKPIIVHPRMDFMLYAIDPIVNQAAKWSSMFGGQASPSITIRSIINRGGEQGAQHSQSLHSWFAHIPGLRVVMPATVADARDLLISATLCDHPVIYIDDRFLYSQTEILGPIKEKDLIGEGPKCLKEGRDITIVSSGYSTYIASKARELLLTQNISVEIIDLRVISPLKPELIIDSVRKTGRLLVLDGGWRTCGLSSEIISLVVENLSMDIFKVNPSRITLPDAPAPTSRALEEIYYFKPEDVVNCVSKMMEKE